MFASHIRLPPISTFKRTGVVPAVADMQTAASGAGKPLTIAPSFTGVASEKFAVAMTIRPIL